MRKRFAEVSQDMLTDGCLRGIAWDQEAVGGSPVIKQTLAKISILVPAYNEEENLPELYKQLTDVFSNVPAEMELLIIDDASTDDTLVWLREISQMDRR